MLGLKVTKDSATSTIYEKAHKQFQYESGKYKALKKQIGLQCYINILQNITIIYGN